MESTIVQHIQTDFYSLVLKTLGKETLLLEWDEVIDNYEVNVYEIEALRKAIENYVARKGAVKLLVKTYDGIVVGSEIQKVLQHKQLYGGIRAVAIELQSTSQRLSLNFTSQFNRGRIPIKGFTSQVNAEKWLSKK